MIRKALQSANGKKYNIKISTDKRGGRGGGRTQHRDRFSPCVEGLMMGGRAIQIILQRMCVCVVIPFTLDVRHVDAQAGITQGFFTFLRCLS